MPETVITLTSGKKILVQESPENVAQKVMHYRQRCNAKDYETEVQE